jgi:hypothetical protein
MKNPRQSPAVRPDKPDDKEPGRPRRTSTTRDDDRDPEEEGSAGKTKL